MYTSTEPPKYARNYYSCFKHSISIIGMSFFLNACTFSAAPTTYDLSAATVQGERALRGQIVIAKPMALQVFSSDRILVKDGSGTISFIPGGQWADQLPDLVQTRLVHTFENSSNMRSVFKAGAGITADYSLSSEIRAFYIDSAQGNAVVELSVRLIAERTGHIMKARIFRAETPAFASEAGTAAQGLNQSLSEVMRDIVLWTTGRK